MNETLVEIVAEIFDIEESDVTPESNPDSVNNWDSLNNLKLVTAVEEEFKIKLSMDEIETILTIGQLDEVIKNKLG